MQESTGDAKLIHAPARPSPWGFVANDLSIALGALNDRGRPSRRILCDIAVPVARVSCQGRLLCVCSLQANQRRIVAKMGKADHENPASNSDCGSEFGLYKCSATANDDKRFWRPDASSHQFLQGEPRPISASRQWHFESVGPAT